MTDVNILAIESSCDETAAAIVQNGKKILSSKIHSQIDIHTVYGGVVPEIASRNHLEKINGVIREALSSANMKLEDMDAIAVTKGPGLIGALLVGVAQAKGIAFALNKPIIGVNHVDGHISAVYIEHDIHPPFMSLVVSGGHTSLIYVSDYGKYELMAKSGDDAAGEAFDKVARALGLAYPGGPQIEKIAKIGNPYAYPLPRPKVAGSNDFSFSGLKTSVLNIINSYKMKGEEISVPDMAASFQQAVVDTLLEKTLVFVSDKKINGFALCGGVAANLTIKDAFSKALEKRNIPFYTPSPVYCTDNAAMIGVAAFYQYMKKDFADFSLNASAAIEI